LTTDDESGNEGEEDVMEFEDEDLDLDEEAEGFPDGVVEDFIYHFENQNDYLDDSYQSTNFISAIENLDIGMDGDWNLDEIDKEPDGNDDEDQNFHTVPDIDSLKHGEEE